MIEIFSGRSGDLTATINGTYIHSSYSPVKEAAKICTTEGLSNYNTVILLGPGLNYLSAEIKKKNSGVKIISIYLFEQFYDIDPGYSDFAFHFSSDVPELKSFLSSSITEFDIENLKHFTFPPAVRHSEHKIKQIESVLLQHIREMHGNIANISGFGKKQFRNFIKNYSAPCYQYTIGKLNSAVLIAGSGPSLHNSASFIKKNRDYLFIISLPSSICFFKSIGIKPDLVISTDPGFYAGTHLASENYDVIAAPFTANIPGNIIENKFIIPLNQSYFLENHLPGSNIYPGIRQHGTVAGSAVYLALQLTSGSVFLSGIDFYYWDVLSHVRPHTFDDILEESARRTSPPDSIYFKRNITGSFRIDGLLRTSQSLKTYSGWFRENSRRFFDRCFHINQLESAANGLKSFTDDEAEKMLYTRNSYNLIKLTEPASDFRKAALESLLIEKSDNLKTIMANISMLTDFSDIFGMIDTDITRNLFLANLLEFRHHFSSKKGKEVTDQALLILSDAEKTISGYLSNVQ